jgi:capsular polysaccharide transport system permease protein
MVLNMRTQDTAGMNDTSVLTADYEEINPLLLEGGVKRSKYKRGVSAVTRFLARLSILCILLSPIIFAVAYYGFIASPRFVSEARFVVKTASRPNIGGGLATLLQMTGISRAQDDTFAVQDFILSQAALAAMPKSVDVRSIYGTPTADALARYPNFFYGNSDEELHKYLQWMITVNYNPNTSISSLKVEAFSALEAQTIAKSLLDMSEIVINRINERIRNDSITNAEAEVSNLERRVMQSQAAITEFRNREMMIDPAASSLMVLELVAQLSSELSRTNAVISEMQAAAPDNPQLPSLIGRADGLEQQIAKERARITSKSDGLADKIAVYERIVIEREFAERMLAAAITSMEAARSEARRQQLYLQRVVEPTLPDTALEPKRSFTIFTFFGGNLILLLIVWLMRTGINSHAFSMRD